MHDLELSPEQTLSSVHVPYLQSSSLEHILVLSLSQYLAAVSHVNDTAVFASLAPVASICSPWHMASPKPVHDTDTAEPAAALRASTTIPAHTLAGWRC